MKILVTGGEGYVGTILVRRLAEQHQVHSIDLGWFSDEATAHVLPTVTHERGDILSVTNLIGYDVVINLAGLSCDPQADYSPGQCFAYNTGGAYHLAKIAKRDGVRRFLQASTASMYGIQDGIAAESDVGKTPQNLTYYGQSKLNAEQGLMSLADDKFAVLCFRKGTLGGWNEHRLRLDLVVNTLFVFGRFEGNITVFDPRAKRPHLDVRDAADLYYNAAVINWPLGCYNVTAGNHTILQMANAVRDKLRGEGHKVNVWTQSNHDPRSYEIFGGRLEPYWTPTYQLKDTINDLYAHTKDPPDDSWWRDSRYYNIKRFKELAECPQQYPTQKGMPNSLHESLTE